MIKAFVGRVWKILPNRWRLKIIRISQTKFTVSVAAIITNEKNDVLILNHVLRPFSGWGLPGGFINRNEEPEVAIRREMREETGIELKDLRMFRVRTINTHVEMLFIAKAIGSPEVRSCEIIELGWFSPGELPAKMSKGQKAIIREILDQEFEKRRRDV